MAQSKSEPYREKPSCQVCAERKAAAHAMHEFSNPGDRDCPECKSSSTLMWRRVCTGGGSSSDCLGGGSSFELKKGWWFTKWGKKSFVCDLPNAPRHFHLMCNTCEHRWTMLSASEKSDAQAP
jgi:hypothetical protein